MLTRSVRTRWLLVLVAAAAMGAAGSYQFVWSSLRPALGARLGASEAALGTVYTVYLVAQTLSQFPAGWFRDRYGPRVPLAVGSVLLAVGYLGTGTATATWQASLWYAVGGVGAGTIYTIAVNTPVKWFTAHRGLATGVVTMAYGGVSVLFIPFVRDGLATDFTGTIASLGLVTGAIAFVGVLVLRDPERSVGGGGESRSVESDDSHDSEPATATATSASLSRRRPLVRSTSTSPNATRPRRIETSTATASRASSSTTTATGRAIWSSTTCDWRSAMDSRAVTPVVEKTITMGIVVLFIGGMTATMFGTAVPTYRDAVGTEMGERVLATATEEIERAIPPNAAAVQSERTVDLPATIRGSAYRIRADGRSLVLEHPDVTTRRSRPALPSAVTGIDGEWQSGANTVVTVRSVSGGLAIELREDGS